MRNDNFEDLKAGDVVLVESHGYGSSELYMSKVVKRTKTRLVTTEGKRERVWTNDGASYPRSVGYGPRSCLVRATDEHVLTYQRHSAIRAIKNGIHRLEQIMRHRNGLDKFNLLELEYLAQTLTKHTKPEEEPDGE